MSGGIYVALSGAVAQANAMETTATNLANAGTDGYQRLRPVFREELLRAQAGKDDRSTLHFTSVATTALDVTRGPIRATGRPLDIALPEKGYLAVSTPGGERYTRGGALRVGTDGTLQAASGTALLGENRVPIRCTPGAEVAVAADGSVHETVAGTPGSRSVGKLRMVTFDDPTQLVPEGGRLLVGSTGAGNPRPMQAPLEVGALEESNAPVVTAMTDLVTASRTFEAFQRAMEAFRDADRKATSVVSGG